MDPEYGMIYANRAARDLMGLGDGDIQGIDHMRFIGPEALASIADRIPDLSAGRKISFETAIKTMNNKELDVLCTVAPTQFEDGTPRRLVSVFRDMSSVRAARDSKARAMTIMASMAEGIVMTGLDGVIEYVNPALERITGYEAAELVGQHTRILKSGLHDDGFYKTLWTTALSGRVWRGNFVNRRKDGSLYYEEASISPIKDADGKVTQFVAIKKDVTKEREMEDQLRQSQRLESIGRLTAGIAHEINTPVQFLGDNIRFLGESFDQLRELLAAHREFIAAYRQANADDKAAARLEEGDRSEDVTFLLDDVPRAVAQSLEGVERVAAIVRSLRDYSHPSTSKRLPIDLNRSVSATVVVATNEWRNVADVHHRFRRRSSTGHLPTDGY
ncbi:MAG: PAS domain S-box protein [Deltaproteobacteria bacterium]|nr:PAS domain S-box protein [Deltaproteobacteria bacterium]